MEDALLFSYDISGEHVYRQGCYSIYSNDIEGVRRVKTMYVRFLRRSTSPRWRERGCVS